jgi:hypothetical protein
VQYLSCAVFNAVFKERTHEVRVERKEALLGLRGHFLLCQSHSLCLGFWYPLLYFLPELTPSDVLRRSVVLRNVLSDELRRKVLQGCVTGRCYREVLQRDVTECHRMSQ